MVIARWKVPASASIFKKRSGGITMTIIWGGTLAVVLSVISKNTYRLIKARFNVKDRIKRLGVYYMCLTDGLI